MNTQDILKDKPLYEFVKQITSNPQFLKLKDCFVAHSPSGEKESTQSPDAIAVAHGKNLGTRFTFNEMERLSQIPFEGNLPKKQFSRTDPDLAT